MDAGNGDIKWTWTHEIDYQTVVDTCDPACFPPGAGSHVHALNYIDGNLWFAGYACSVFAIDAKSGDVSYQIDDICKDVPGNDGGFYANNGVFPPSIHRGSNTLVHSWSAQDANWGGRGFMYGIDLDKVPKGVPYSANFDADGWRFFTTPHRDGDPDYTIRHCDKGYFFVAKEYIARRNSDGTTENPQHRVEGTNTGGQVHCSDVPEANLKNDWHIPKDEWIQSSSRKTPIHITTSTTAMWGQFPLDEETGMVYGCTGNASPWHNHTIGGYGPWWPATALLGVQAETGELVWWHQTVPRDNWDWDCNWSTKLALVDIEGYGQQKVVLRHSKIGYMWALDAATGEAFWGTRHTNLKYYDHQCQSGDYPQCVDVDASASCRCYYMLDPREKLDMEQQWGLPGPDGYDEPIQFLQIPSIGGAAESEFSYNPDTQTIYIISQNVVWDVGITPTLDEPHGISSSFTIPPEIQKNTSLLAIDASNGEELWSFYIPDTGHRGGVFESGGVVYLPSGDGNLYMVDAANGQLLAKKAFGQPLYSQSTIGKASNGDSIIFQLYGGTFWAGFGLGIDAEHVPGALVAYHVPDDAVQAQVVVQEVEVEKIVEKEVEVITEVPVEVEKIVTKEVPVEVEKIITKEVPVEVEKIVIKEVTTKYTPEEGGEKKSGQAQTGVAAYTRQVLDKSKHPTSYGESLSLIHI